MSIQEIDFMHDIDAAKHMKPAKLAAILMFTIIAFIAAFFIWASVTKVEELTRGQGKVIPTQDIQIVQSLEGGVVEELLVQKGEVVKKGQILMRISDVIFSSQARGTESKSYSLKAKKARLTAEANATNFEIPQEIKDKIPAIVENEKRLYDTRQNELQAAYAIQDEKIAKANADLQEVKAEIKRLTNSQNLLNKELKITREMVAQRAAPKLEQIRLEREWSDIGGQINVRKQKKLGLQAELDSAKKQRETQFDTFKSLSLEELNIVETEIAGLKENLKSISDRVDRAELRAPVDGIVNQISVQTIGGVVEPAQKVMEIVPANDVLKIVATIKPNDIAFLAKGQPVKVKISAYDPQKYGSLDGTLSRIAANSITDNDGNPMFEVEVITEKTHLGTADAPLPITTGMVADIEVITGKRTIMNYLMKPLYRGMNRALTER